MITNPHLVSVLTPVYNGEKYLAECIESVLKQDYQNWEYILVNNCSTDSTLDIATRYANTDPRIRVITNSKFVDAEENHNIAFSLISPESKYCKVVSADDWIYPECITRMIEVAEIYPSVGIVGSYQLRGEEVRWKGIPNNVEFISGPEICRTCLLNNIEEVFGGPTSLLYRSDLIRKNKPFFPNHFPYADTSAFYKYLQYCDFGFVHEILSIERVHEQQESSRVRSLHMSLVAYIDILLGYGPIYLSEREFETQKKETLDRYYKWLGVSILKIRSKEFWAFQTSRIRELGYPLRWRKILRGALDEILEEIQNPKVAYQKFLIALRERLCDRK